ncbi:MAG: hypothetical protein ACOCV8_04710, partial [Spirochaetota bacterium]
VSFPALINLGIIIYSIFYSKEKENLDNTIKRIIFIIFYIIVLITFSISIIVMVLLYLDITPQISKFFDI